MAILCCLCGTSMEPNGVNMCTQCLSNQVDITEGIDRESMLHQCKGCLRFQRNSQWVANELESPELMALCLKTIHGLAKVKLLDANFVWTEPHSKRIKVKLTIRKEVLSKIMLQQSFVVEFVVKNLKCPDCSKQYHNATWKSLVQVRQKVSHKRTFFHLEQLILQQQAHKKCVGIDSVKEGMDFYFAEKNSGEKFVHFLTSSVPCKSKSSSKLISTDNHNNTANIQTTFVVEIVPICKHDLVILPKSLAQHCGNISNLAVVHRITSQIRVVDPFTGQTAEISADKFWRHPFPALLTSQEMIEFTVLDTEWQDPTKSQSEGKFHVSDVEVARSTDFGYNDQAFHVFTHLGGILKSGDTVLGFDLTSCNFGTRATYQISEYPDIILIKREFKRTKPMRLKSLGAKEKHVTKKTDILRAEADYETFLTEFAEETTAVAVATPL